MTAEPSPRPWRVNSLTGGHISDANGNPVCFCVGSNCGERAALIVDAVNERDRPAADEARYRTHNVVLRDIVRRFLDQFTPGTIHPAGTMERLLREARAAIGAGETPTGKGVGL